MYYTQLWTTNDQPKSSTIALNGPVVRSTPENSDKRLASFNLIALLITNNVTYHNVLKVTREKNPVMINLFQIYVKNSLAQRFTM